MTIWEFIACTSAVAKFHGGGKEKAPEMTDDVYDALCEIGDKWSSENNVH